MLKKLYYTFYNLYQSVITSIALYPTFCAVLGVFFGIYFSIVDFSFVYEVLDEYVPQLLVRDAENARSIINTLVGGAISMLVFSFSMVMLLLSQSASNYSPRVLPGLVSNWRHQLILGNFLFTIIYNIIIAINLGGTTGNDRVPAISILFGILFTVNSIIGFIYFLHTISNAIQVDNIIGDVYGATERRINKILEALPNKKDYPDSVIKADTVVYYSKKSGYLRDYSPTKISKFCHKNNLHLSVMAYKGMYLLEGEPIFKTDKELDEQLETKIYKYFAYADKEHISNNYLLGIKQLTEVGVKAMSPGINDPGTCITTIDKLTHLLALRMQLPDRHFSFYKNEPIVEYAVVPFTEVIYQTIASYRRYCREDFTTSQKLLQMLKKLYTKEDATDEIKASLVSQKNLLLKDAEAFNMNESDLNRLKSMSFS